MAMNLALRNAVAESKHKRQFIVAKLARIHKSKFSEIVNGHVEPSEDEQNRIARVLGKSRAELFAVNV